MCKCKELQLKVGDKVKWNGTKLDTDSRNFNEFYYNNSEQVFTVGLIEHIQFWRQSTRECFIRFREVDNKSGWGFSELDIVKKRQQILKLP